MQQKIEELTVHQLLALYNSYGPTRRLRTWKGRKADLIIKVRIAAKQSTPYGITSGVSRIDL